MLQEPSLEKGLKRICINVILQKTGIMIKFFLNKEVKMKKIFAFLFYSFSLVFGMNFNQVAEFSGSNFQNAAVSDFNRDGYIDIAVVKDNEILVFPGKKQSPYFNEPIVTPVTGYFQYITVNDFNRDGKPDIAVSSHMYPEKMKVLLGNGDGTFQQPSTYGAGAYPNGITNADFNRDGIDDIAVVSQDSSVFYCYLGNGDGTFNLASVNPTSYVSVDITSADFDNDGIMDVAVTGYFNGYLHIFKGKGDGTFNEPINLSISSPWAISKGDFNRDGKIDLVVTNRSGSGMVSVLIGKGDCTFESPAHYEVGGEPWGVSVNDFDGDGISDLAIACGQGYEGYALKILKGKGDGTFQSVFSRNFQSIKGVVSEDFNHDGKKDIAVLCYDRIVILINTTEFKISGTFSEPVNYWVTGQSPVDVITYDFNNDGILDIAVSVSTQDGGNVLIYTGKNDGTFNSPVSYQFPAGFYPQYLTTSDFNRDGKPDIAVSSSVNKLGIMQNNGNGTFTITTILLNYEGVYAPFTNIVSGDFNRDGKPDIALKSNHSTNSGILVLLGGGDGTFTYSAFYPLQKAGDLALCDFNKDGIVDMGVTRRYINGAFLFTGKGDGTFYNSKYISSLYDPTGLVFDDFNIDGNPDIAFCDYQEPSKVSIWNGDGNGNFALGTEFNAGDYLFDINCADFNRDGADDLIILNVPSSLPGPKILLAFGNNDGTFNLADSYSNISGYPIALAIGDFDRNGSIDTAVLSGSYGESYLNIFYNLLIEKGDISGEGTIDISDVILCLRMAIELPVEIGGTVYTSPYPLWLVNRAKLADDGEPTITISDVIKVLRKAIGLD